MRIGFGYDAHAFAPERKLVLCGVIIPHPLGLLGHSDADVATHALMDALLGGAALGDIGKHFPASDERYRGADSLEMLRACVQMIGECGYILGNADITIICEKPRLANYIDNMRQALATALDAALHTISVKATTTERMGFTGREEGIAACAAVLLEEKNTSTRGDCE